MSVFIGPHGLRSGWRFLLFVSFAAVLGLVFGLGAHFSARIFGQHTADVLQNFVLALTVVSTMWIMGKVEGRPVWNYGFSAPNGDRNLASGLAAGILALSVLMGLLVAAGAYKPGPPLLRGAEVLEWGVYWALLFVGVALSEESTIRSYPLFSLSQGLGFWPAAVILSVVFGAGHLGNKGEEWLGIANAMIAGLVLAYSVRWTGSLWWAIGYHMSWDWGESFFYGVADSGSLAHHHFLSFAPQGAGWLSGGSVGPEGSVIATIVLLALVAVVRLTTPAWHNPALDRLRPVPPSLPVEDAENPGGVPVT